MSLAPHATPPGGDTPGSRPFSPETIARFWSQVDRETGPVQPTLGRCWPYSGHRDGDGYGIFGGKRAHRIACAIAHGAPPFAGAEAAHACDYRPCCNGAHLSWKTHADNVGEQFQRGRHRNFTKYGKPYTCGTCGGKGHNARTCGAREARS